MVDDRIRARRMRLALFLTAGVYLFFVIYGSLVPFDFRWVPPAEAWARFRSIPYLKLDIGSRADWIANILLFIPLSFLWLGALAPRGRAGARALTSGFVWIACVALSVGIEYAQVYVPPRTVSLNDVVAEMLGAGTGIAAWWVAGERALAALGRWRALRGETGLAEWLLWPYLLLLAAYNLLPLDLTLSLYNLGEKWKAGRIVLLPFASPVTDPLQRVYGPAVEALLWLALAALWILSGRGGPLVAWCVTVLVATGIAVAQIFVYSRVSDVTSLLSAAAGAAAGVWLAARLPHRLRGAAAPGAAEGRAAASGGSPLLGRGALLGLVACVGWSLILLVASWYPFDFQIDPATSHARLHLLKAVPFLTHDSGMEHPVLTEVLHKAVSFAPLGASLAIACAGVRGRLARSVCAAGSLALVACAAVGIELGQVFLPSRFPSLTDAAIEWFGGALGFWAVGAIRARLAPWRPRRKEESA